MTTEKILIVDDEDVNLKILINYLLSEDYDIDTTVNGEEAVRKSQEILDTHSFSKTLMC